MKSAGALGAVVCALALTLLAGCNTDNSESIAPPTSSAESAQSATAPAPAPAASDSSATLTWLPPTANTDGSVITDLAGYRIYYGTNENALNQVIDISNIGVTTYIVDGLTTGTWYFAIRAYTADGTESSLSNVATKTVS